MNTFEFDNKEAKVGDIVKVHGKNHRVTKKTTTAIAVERYYFWDKWLDRLKDGIKKNSL